MHLTKAERLRRSLVVLKSQTWYTMLQQFAGYLLGSTDRLVHNARTKEILLQRTSKVCKGPAKLVALRPPGLGQAGTS